MPKLPWWGWIAIIYLIATVFLDLDLKLVPLLIVGFFVMSMSNRIRQRPGVSGPTQRPPTQPHAIPTPPAPQAPPGQPYPTPGAPGVPTDDVPAPRSHPGATAYPIPTPPPQPDPGMQRIDTPRYPGHQSSDPTISLGQLHLARCARDLAAAAATGETYAVSRVLDEVVHLCTSQRSALQSAVIGGGSNGDRAAYLSGLQRLEREATAARAEVPPGDRVAAVVRGASRMSETGRYE